MKTFASLPPGERALFFQQYQQLHDVDPVIVEKDFWVCRLLGRVFAQPALGRTTVFKGGTSLAKVFNAISRFSEDVDFGINPDALGWPEERLENATRNAWNERIRPELEAACAQHVSSHWLPRLESDILTQLGARPGGSAWLTYKLDAVSHSPILFFAYPGALPQSIGYIAREVKMEFGSLADQRPAGRHQITAMVAELAPAAFADFGAEVVALEIERTFWEKATILHAEFHRPTDKKIQARYARHYADFAALWRHPSARGARHQFDLLERVRHHKSRFFSSVWANYATAVPGMPRLVPPDHRLPELRSDYAAMRQMFLNEPLPFDETLTTLHEAENVLNAS